MSSSTAVVRRRESDMALMPPPPVKRIKRPATVLDEDEYTEALSDIIARDYFPGLAEVRAQDEYLNALESQNSAWIADASRKLRATVSEDNGEKKQRSERDTKYNTPRSWDQRTPAADTPRGTRGDETPITMHSGAVQEESKQSRALDTSTLSLSGFQSRYTSEDNESFYQVLDKQNLKRREKYAHLWTKDQLIPSDRLMEHRTTQAKLIKQNEEEESTATNDGRELIPLTSGAIASRPAKPDSWQQKKPDNTFMFNANSVDEDGLQTVMEVKEANSKAGPKQVIYANTRFPSLQFADDPGPIPPSPSLNTSIIARREAASTSDSFAGDETPRVNGYAFVDEDEPTMEITHEEPSYRDILAGQVDSTPNPFNIQQKSKREELHYRLVDKEKAKRRAKERETIRPEGRNGGSNVTNAGNMTPAARKLMEKLGRTPVPSQKTIGRSNMWTPGNTPRRK